MMNTVKLERVASTARFVYYGDNGQVFRHANQRDLVHEGREAAYMLEVDNGRVWRLTNGKRIRVTLVEFVEPKPGMKDRAAAGPNAVKLEKVLSFHRYVYYRGNGQVFAHVSKRDSRHEGKEAVYMLETATGKVWRLTGTRHLRVTAVEFVPEGGKDPCIS